MSKPMCPNHHEPLEIPASERHLKKGSAPCPVSGEMFDYEQDVQTQQQTKDKYGNIITTFTVEGND